MLFLKYIITGIFLLSVSFSNLKAQNEVKHLDIPNVNSSLTESYFILTKNEDTLYFVRAQKFTSKAKKTIYTSVKQNGSWSKPIPISFNLENFSDDSPFLTLDGKTMFFTSNRPGSIEGSKDVWKSTRVKGKWSKPINLGGNVNSPSSEFGVSVAQNGNLYFGSSRKESKGMGDIYFSKLTKGKYDKAVNLGENINTKTGEWGSVVAPDESFIIFESHGRESNVSFAGDLYISYRRDGKWQQAKNMLKFNSIGSDLAPRMNSFLNILYFSSNRNDEPKYGDNTNVYYVDLSEILKNKIFKLQTQKNNDE
ncbi:hypothetical protein [Psychroserpens algicola]|uniref:WD40-like Beta Propeller Repeat n=1 Tax=Psychroserpens algicola TaxID=1719034 RepID=A0ABT0H7G9_9FLAO|nr:hypothetical protein [Psychroserpens algicola]MCK8479785.1 hypothetical protein [Psychroserpens algicola]